MVKKITKTGLFSLFFDKKLKKIAKKFGGNKKMSTFAIPNENKTFEKQIPE